MPGMTPPCVLQRAQGHGLGGAHSAGAIEEQSRSGQRPDGFHLSRCRREIPAYPPPGPGELLPWYASNESMNPKEAPTRERRPGRRRKVRRSADSPLREGSGPWDCISEPERCQLQVTCAVSHGQAQVSQRHDVEGRTGWANRSVSNAPSRKSATEVQGSTWYY